MESLKMVQEMDPSEQEEATQFLNETLKGFSQTPPKMKNKKKAEQKSKPRKRKEMDDANSSVDSNAASPSRLSRRCAKTPKRFSDFEMEEFRSQKNVKEASSAKSLSKSRMYKVKVKNADEEVEDGEVSLGDLDLSASNIETIAVKPEELDAEMFEEAVIVKVEDPSDEMEEGESESEALQASADPSSPTSETNSLSQMDIVDYARRLCCFCGILSSSIEALNSRCQWFLVIV
jgi:hypothetical protein